MADIFEKSLVIDLASHMDSRTSSEYLELNPNQSSLIFRNLENADLFKSKALSTRLGSIDLGGGIINSSGAASSIYNLYSGTGSNTGYVPATVFLEPFFPDREGMVINFSNQGTSGINTFGLYGGTLFLQDTSASGTIVEAGYDIQVQVYVAGISGVGLSSPTLFTDAQQGLTHSIALSGNFNTTFDAPSLINVDRGPFNTDPTPLAISDTVIINFGSSSNYAFSGGIYQTPYQKIQWQLSAPFQFNTNTPYYIYIVANNTSGVSSRGLNANVMYDNKDDQINCMYANLFTEISVSGTFKDILRTAENSNVPSGTKGFLAGEIDKYNSPSYNLVEYPYVTNSFTSPISGANNNPELVYQDEQNYLVVPYGSSFPTYPGNTQIPPVSTTNAEFGTTFTLASGSIVNGGYLYANTWTNPLWNAYNTNPASVNLSGSYAVNYICNFYQVLGTGTNNYLETDLLTSYSGNYTFSNTNNYQNPYFNSSVPGADINVGFEKIQSLFNNPATTPSSGTYLLSWQWLNSSSNQPLTDYEVISVQNVSNFYNFASPILIGQSPSGQDLVRREANGFIGYSGNAINPAMGLISFPSGNGITLVYDYSIGSERAEQIIVGQGSNLYTSSFVSPEIRETIFSGGQIGNEFLWTANSYQNLFFASQYSNSGTQVCWDQIYETPSGNWTQPWGQQPQWSMYPVSGIVASTGNSNYSGQSLGYGLMSGDSVQVMLATQMNSGGFRANVQNFTASGNNIWIGLSGTDIFRTSGNSSNSQYNFDIYPNQATYVFTTQAADINGQPVSGLSPNDSGIPATTAIFYLSEILNQASGLSTVLENPLQNSGTFTGSIQHGSGSIINPTGKMYLGNFDANTLTQQIPTILGYDQSYLDEQIPTPLFKKNVIFYNYVVGVGDPNNSSTAFYCGIGNAGLGQPQIWGTDGNVCGYLPVNPNDGSPITGIEVFRDNLFIFKYNAIYRYTYTGNPQNPFYRYTMSTNLGSLGFFGTVSTDYGVFFLSQFGPALVNLGPPDTIGDEIMPTFNQFSETDLTFAVAIYDRERQQIYWSISNSADSEYNSTGLVYSTVERAWSIRQGGMWLSAGIVYNFDNFNQLWVGTSQGQLQQISVGNTDSDTLFVDINGNSLDQGITLTAETPWLNFGNSNDLKRLKNIRFNCESSQQQLRVDAYYDQDDSLIQWTRYMTMNNAVIQRVISAGGRPFRTIKLVFTTVGTPDNVEIKSMQFTYSTIGLQSPI